MKRRRGKVCEHEKQSCWRSGAAVAPAGQDRAGRHVVGWAARWDGPSVEGKGGHQWIGGGGAVKTWGQRWRGDEKHTAVGMKDCMEGR
jgi:hypothetical protein